MNPYFFEMFLIFIKKYFLILTLFFGCLTVFFNLISDKVNVKILRLFIINNKKFDAILNCLTELSDFTDNPNYSTRKKVDSYFTEMAEFLSLEYDRKKRH